MKKIKKYPREELAHARVPKDIINFCKQAGKPIRVGMREMYNTHTTVLSLRKGIEREIYGKKQKR